MGRWVQAGLIKFASSATTVLNLTNNKTDLKNKVSSLYASGGTNANAGILEGISVLDSADANKEKMLVLVCDGSVSYVESTVEAAIDKGITIHCINVINGNSDAMQKIAEETGGIYYYAATTAEVEKVVEELTGDTVSTTDITDTDGDGLYDVYETNGMRLSNGQIVYTDPEKADTDGDGISDYDAMGGEPVTETFMLDGNTYSCTLNHSKVYGKLSPEFIYVDGTINADGKQYYGEMSYVPYSNVFIEQKYRKETDAIYDDEVRTVCGDAGIYNSFRDKLSTISKAKLLQYAAIGTYTTMAVSLLDTQAADCLYTYILGTGGSEEGLVDGGTREYIYATPRLGTNIFGINSANTYFMENMNRVKKSVESVLNEYNTEIYITLSPTTQWTGCAYNDCTMDDWRQNIDSLLNIGAFGIYNKADAGVTVHCIYDPDTKQYSMEFIYYIIDLYDFALYDELNEMNALGLARCYELYGVSSGVTSWNKDDAFDMYWMY